jgi:Flp pilus assembly protein TadB
MNTRQIFQLILAACGLGLIIFWLILPGWSAGKILGIISNIMLIIAMLISFRAEERLKKNKNQ